MVQVVELVLLQLGLVDDLDSNLYPIEVYHESQNYLCATLV